MLDYIWIILILFVAFMFFVVCFNYDKIKNLIKSKKPIIKKQKEPKTPKEKTSKKEKNEPKKEEVEFIPKNQVSNIPDSTYDFEEYEPENTPSDLDETEKSGIEDDIDFLKNLKISQSKQTKKSISKTIKDLPPEIKAMLIDNTLKRRDDV